MNEAEKLLVVSDSGPVNFDPLATWGVRYYPKIGQWRRIDRFHNRMPTRVSRSTVAAEVGVAESVIENWEAAMRAAVLGQEPNAIDLLKIGPDGPFDSDPLANWHFRYYPQSRIWRRTRAQRNEISREDVAKKVRVSVEVLIAWENSFHAMSEPRNSE